PLEPGGPLDAVPVARYRAHNPRSDSAKLLSLTQWAALTLPSCGRKKSASSEQNVSCQSSAPGSLHASSDHIRMMLTWRWSMTTGHKTTTLAPSLKAFEIDTSWYESYWYDGLQPKPGNPSVRFFQAIVWFTVFAAGVYFVI